MVIVWVQVGASGGGGGAWEAQSEGGVASLSARAELLKREANGQFARANFTPAIELYAHALRHAPASPVLYANRAAAYMKRGWWEHQVGGGAWEAQSEGGVASLSARAELLKREANGQFARANFTPAIELYAHALRHAPASPVLYANRAAAYMKRGWDGDEYAALRDCYAALRLDAQHLKALFRIAKCLHELKHPVEAQGALELFKLKFPEHAKSPAFSSLDREIKDALFSEEKEEKRGSKRKRLAKEKSSTTEKDLPSQASGNSSSGNSSSSNETSPAEAAMRDLGGAAPREPRASPQETALRQLAADYEQRFCGHCNTTTDIKEANFFGCEGEYVVAGSDDGTFFVWERAACGVACVLRGDESIVNCLQPHPTHCLLATSGIESTVKLWSPRPENGSENNLRVDDVVKAAQANQRRMNADPLEVMLFNMGYRLGPNHQHPADDPPPAPHSPANPDITTIQCRQS